MDCGGTRYQKKNLFDILIFNARQETMTNDIIILHHDDHGLAAPRRHYHGRVVSHEHEAAHSVGAPRVEREETMGVGFSYLNPSNGRTGAPSRQSRTTKRQVSVFFSESSVGAENWTNR